MLLLMTVSCLKDLILVEVEMTQLAVDSGHRRKSAALLIFQCVIVDAVSSMVLELALARIF